MTQSPDTVLLSIHPTHVSNIVKGIKRFELRRRIPLHIKQIAIYATAPESRIIGICQIEDILTGTPDALWPKICGAACVDFPFYSTYFKGVDKAYAIRLGRLSLISREIRLSHPRLAKTPPQSFTYLDTKQSAWLADCSDKMVSGGTKKVFVGGIHASGKSYLSQNIISSYGYHCVSASQLIANGRGEVNSDKSVSSIDENQQLLLAGIKKAQSIYSHLAIDGHFCLINEKGKVEEIPFETFESLNPELIVLAMPPLMVIKQRLAQRKNKTALRTSLGKFQQHELEYAKRVAKQLDIPLEVVDTSRNCEFLHRQLDLIFNGNPHANRTSCSSTL